MITSRNSNNLVTKILFVLTIASNFFEHIAIIPMTISKFLFIILMLNILLFNSYLFIKTDKVFKLFIAFTFFFSISTLINVSAISSSSYFSYALGQPFRLLMWVLLYYISYCLFMRNNSFQELLIYTIFFSALLVSILMYWGIGVTNSDYMKYNRSSFQNLDPNALGAYIGLGIIATASLLSSNKSNKLRIKIAYFISLIILGLALVNTGSRGAFIATILGLATYIYTSRGRRRIAFSFGIVLMLSILTYQLMQSEISVLRWTNTIKDRDSSNRDVLFSESWKLFTKHPIIGRGEINSYLELGKKTGGTEAGMHNDVLWALNSSGILGTGFFILSIGILFNFSLKSDFNKSVSFALITFTTIMSMTVEYHHRKILWIIFAYISASYYYSKTQKNYSKQNNNA